MIAFLLENLVFSSLQAKISERQGKLREAYAAMPVRRLSTFSEDALQQALASWRRWSTWAAEQEPQILPLPSSAVYMALFLEDVALGKGMPRKNAGGPTVAHSVRIGPHFLERHLGFNFNTKDPAVASAGALTCSHKTVDPLSGTTALFLCRDLDCRNN